MENEKTYDMPYVGCLMGSAFQRLTIQLETTLKREGLEITAAEYMILRALYSRDGLQQCEIVDMVGKDKSSICRSVSALAKKNLVVTEPVSYNVIRVGLTAKAREEQPKVKQITKERHEALLKLASQKDIEAFVRVLKAIMN
ncbi:MAG: MarR family winged helix-turn-helix transcriptional regulator [Muribaculaceae bacterium]|nr:MarR family winged helix-turn-helix transcriptional regulator [Muribaculaceae bacterium]